MLGFETVEARAFRRLPESTEHRLPVAMVDVVAEGLCAHEWAHTRSLEAVRAGRSIRRDAPSGITAAKQGAAPSHRGCTGHTLSL